MSTVKPWVLALFPVGLLCFFFFFLLALCLLASSVTMAQPVAIAAHPWTATTADGPAGVADAQVLPPAAEGAQQPALAEGQAPGPPGPAALSPEEVEKK
jgi:hypothetical protein